MRLTDKQTRELDNLALKESLREIKKMIVSSHLEYEKKLTTIYFLINDLIKK